MRRVLLMFFDHRVFGIFIMFSCVIMSLQVSSHNRFAQFNCLSAEQLFSINKKSKQKAMNLTRSGK